MTQHLISTPARLQPCPSCGALTLLAVSGGLAVRADTAPAGIGEEIAALLAGRGSYDVLVHGLPRRVWLEWRDLVRIKAGRRYPVALTHECGLPATGSTPGKHLPDLVFPHGEPLPDYPPF